MYIGGDIVVLITHGDNGRLRLRLRLRLLARLHR
jgi:hypothetical protein